MLKIFLCHGNEDKPAVRDLYRRLRTDGLDPWLDEQDLVPGQKWEPEIRKAVRRSDVVLVCLSKRSASKEGFVQKEIKFALDTADEKPEGAIYLIPLKLDECQVPDRLAEWQCVNLFERDGYSKLVRALRQEGKAVPPRPTRRVLRTALALGCVIALALVGWLFRDALKYPVRPTALAIAPQIKPASPPVIPAVKNAPPDNSRKFADAIDKGDRLFNSKDYTGAAEVYSTAIRFDRRSAIAYRDRADANLYLDNYGLAIQDYSQAIALGSEDGEIYFERGEAYYGAEKYQQAFDDFEKALQLKPDYALAIQWRGHAKYKLGDNAGAEADWNKAKELGYQP